MREAALRPKKRYGQNFLSNASAAREIGRLALASAPQNARTLEIGAGTGALTRALLESGAQLTVLEIDPQLVAVLRSREDLSSVQILQADALTFDYASWAAGRPWIVAANLPYNVATPIILRLTEMPDGPDAMTVMVQKDVADRFVATPGTPAYGSLSVAVQYAMNVERAFTLSPESFFPKPKVDSTVVRLSRRPEPAVRPRDPAIFWKVVRGAFAYRRKTLANSLSLALDLDRERISRALQSSNLSPELRGERLDLGDFARLADALAEG
ncbi:MAG TPA: 16S rRNA (adenine(1518)-N(6)/adenine(1519)-N(6))-dimethyltransferase RsmA [Candidatus Cybelea sp.]|nr:16S rRNA (adenine(1518)-N(6)/adenine(1519)-N(6))-dimethyltransferase RsmA [Candidatus Cybelea sp.]